MPYHILLSLVFLQTVVYKTYETLVNYFFAIPFNLFTTLKMPFLNVCAEKIICCTHGTDEMNDDDVNENW